MSDKPLATRIAAQLPSAKNRLPRNAAEGFVALFPFRLLPAMRRLPALLLLV